MTFEGILAALALLSLGLTLWQWIAARRFALHRRTAWNASLRLDDLDDTPIRAMPGRKPALPSVTLLKPLKGVDKHTEACLRSWFVQEYAGEIQLLFAVADA